MNHFNIKTTSQNNYAFATATKVLREIEVSHWGNVAIEELVDLVHTGAKLDGTFSRLDHKLTTRYTQEFSGEGLPYFRSLKASLPAEAIGVYYRDIIGNISTSHVREVCSTVTVVVAVVVVVVVVVVCI